MQREMSTIHMQEWMIFNELEPFGEERADFRAAHIVQTIINSIQNLMTIVAAFGRAKLGLKSVSLEECMLSIGDRAKTLEEQAQKEKEVQTPEQVEHLLKQWFVESNVAASLKAPE